MPADEPVNSRPNPNPPEGFEVFPHSDGFLDLVGPVFACIKDGRPVLGFRVEPRHCNPAGICHGGMMMSVMDVAIGIATAHDAENGGFTPSVNLTYDFVTPGYTGDWLESRIDWVHTTYKTGFANGYLIGPKGPVLRANGICKIVRGDNSKFQMKSGKTLDFPPKEV